MGAMGFVAKDGHMMLVGEFNDVFKRTDRAKIGRVDDEDRFGGRVAENRFAPILKRRLVGDFKSLSISGIT
jgi:hypothetical protein